MLKQISVLDIRTQFLISELLTKKAREKNDSFLWLGPEQTTEINFEEGCTYISSSPDEKEIYGLFRFHYEYLNDKSIVNNFFIILFNKKKAFSFAKDLDTLIKETFNKGFSKIKYYCVEGNSALPIITKWTTQNGGFFTGFLENYFCIKGKRYNVYLFELEQKNYGEKQ